MTVRRRIIVNYSARLFGRRPPPSAARTATGAPWVTIGASVGLLGGALVLAGTLLPALGIMPIQTAARDSTCSWSVHQADRSGSRYRFRSAHASLHSCSNHSHCSRGYSPSQ
jgi:hypothetical protein